MFHCKSDSKGSRNHKPRFRDVPPRLPLMIHLFVFNYTGSHPGIAVSQVEAPGGNKTTNKKKKPPENARCVPARTRGVNPRRICRFRQYSPPSLSPSPPSICGIKRRDVHVYILTMCTAGGECAVRVMCGNSCGSELRLWALLERAGALGTMHTDVVLLFMLVWMTGASGQTRPKGQTLQRCRNVRSVHCARGEGPTSPVRNYAQSREKKTCGWVIRCCVKSYTSHFNSNSRNIKQWDFTH